jgi:hypothetical protein
MRTLGNELAKWLRSALSATGGQQRQRGDVGHMLPGFTAEHSLTGAGSRYRPPAVRNTRGADPATVTPQRFDLNTCVNNCYSPDQECVDACYTLDAIQMATDMVLGPFGPF